MLPFFGEVMFDWRDGNTNGLDQGVFLGRIHRMDVGASIHLNPSTIDIVLRGAIMKIDACVFLRAFNALYFDNLPWLQLFRVVTLCEVL